VADTAQPTVTPPESPPSGGGPPRRYLGRAALAVALVVTGLVLVLTIGVRNPVAPAAAPPVQPAPAIPGQRPQPGAEAPRAGLAAPVDRPAVSDQAELDAWAARVAGKTHVPPRVLAAYGRAEMWMQRQKPTCHLSWATLAGIGRVAAGRGKAGTAAVRPDGRVVLPVVGPPLDGSPGVPAVHDTDGGKLDGDKAWDHLIGPLQLPPSTWKKYQERANGDGGPPDPQNVDDAAFTAARFLCSGSDDLGTPAGWWRAVLFYNPGLPHGQDVFSAADAYAEASVAP
jgi:membrane-bound lytic murein transglycosylase B